MSVEYENLQRALNQSSTPEGRKIAAQAMRAYLAAKGNAVSLASMGISKSYPNIVSLDSLSDRIEHDSELAKLLDEVINNKY